MSYSMLVPRRAGRQRMAIRAAVMIANLMCKLKPARLERLMRLASRRTRAIDTELLEQLYDEICRVDPRVAGWRGCLPRSIAICLLCRWEGTWPDGWRSGIHRAPPFSAHAWIENEGRIVRQNNVPDDYRPLLTADGQRTSAA